MTINQISIFIENKYGKLAEIFELLASREIRVLASTVADTSEYGILRLVASEPQRALSVLRDANISANLTTVFAFSIDESRSSISQVINAITERGTSVEYIYYFSNRSQSMLIMRTNNESATREAIRHNNLTTLSEVDLLTL